jgi:hypothetical protein
MKGLLGRMESALDRLLDRLCDAGLMDIGEGDRQALITSTLLQMTFWIAYAEIRDPDALESGRALPQAAARVLHGFIPYLRQDAAEPFRELAREYLRP